MNKKEKPVLTVENYILNWKYTCNDFIVENSGFQDKNYIIVIELYIFKKRKQF